MTIIQAYRRTKPYSHQFVGEAPLFFRPNERADIVCEVQDEHSVERLLATPTGFRVYPFAPVPVPAEVPAASVLSEVLTPPQPPSPEPASEPQEPAEPGEGGNSSTETQEPADDAHPYVLKSDDAVYDMRGKDDAALREFAKTNGIQVGRKLHGNAIRDVIVAALKQ